MIFLILVLFFLTIFISYGLLFVMYNNTLRPRKGGWRKKEDYIHGVGLGGHFLIETWLFPNIPMAGSSEWEYIQNMVKYIGPENAIKTIHNHYENYLSNKQLQNLADMGINDIRIAVGWWIFEAPVSGPNGRLSGGINKCVKIEDSDKLTTMYDSGFSKGGFVTGGIKYLEKLIKKLKKLKITAYIDMHAYPGGAQSPAAYQGDGYNFQMWCGVDECYNQQYSEWSKESVLKCAKWIKSLENNPETSNVIWCLELVNEPQLGGNDNELCQDGSSRQIGDAMVDWFKDIIPRIREVLPSNEYTLMQGFLTGPNEDRKRQILDIQDDNLWYDNHYYNAFDQCSWSCAGNCPKGNCSGLFQCKICCCDKGDGMNLDFVIGEWSLGLCNMDVNVPPENRSPELLANLFIQQKTMFMYTGAKGDYFWAARSGVSYDPTIYPRNWVKPESVKTPEKIPDNSLIEWDLLKLYKNKIVYPFDKYKINGKCDYTIPEKSSFKYDCSKGCYGSAFGYECACKNSDGVEKKCC